MDAGARMVLVVQPAVRTLEVHRYGQQPVTLHAGDTLDGADVVPGFGAPVTTLFACTRRSEPQTAPEAP